MEFFERFTCLCCILTLFKGFNWWHRVWVWVWVLNCGDGDMAFDEDTGLEEFPTSPEAVPMQKPPFELWSQRKISACSSEEKVRSPLVNN